MSSPSLCPRWILSLAVVSISAGCASIHPTVRIAVDATRDEAAALHASHVRDVRTLGLTINRERADLQNARRALRAARLAEVQARIAAAKAEIMSVYDRRVVDIIGVEFAHKLQDDLYTPLAQIERRQVEAVDQAMREKRLHANDPMLPERELQARNNLAATQCGVVFTVARNYQAVHAVLSSRRFDFERRVDDAFARIDLTPLSDDEPEAESEDLARFNSSLDERLVLLDASYGAIDQSLSDLSTALDAEATSRRFAGHALRGAGGALVQELKTPTLFSAGLAKAVGTVAPDVLKQIRAISEQFKPEAVNAANAAAASIPPPNPVADAAATAKVG